MKHLVYGRIILDKEVPSAVFATGDFESGLICLSGQCTINADGQTFELDRYDSIYLPRETDVEVTTASAVDLVECSAAVEKKYPLQLVRYADVEKDAALKFKTGGSATTRTVNITLGKNVEAGRILAGFTTSEPGHWTSWPPHEHCDARGTIRTTTCLRPPLASNLFTPIERTGIHWRGARRRRRDHAQRFSSECFVPSHPINFVWLMAAHREVEDRQFGVVTVQPGFDQGGSGLEASRK